MKAKEFITQGLLEIREIYSEFTPLYEYHEYSDTHFIKVIPEAINELEIFEELAGKLIDNFDKKYPLESICFIAKDTLNQLECPERLFPLPMIQFNEQVEFVTAILNNRVVNNSYEISIDEESELSIFQEPGSVFLIAPGSSLLLNEEINYNQAA